VKSAAERFRGHQLIFSLRVVEGLPRFNFRIGSGAGKLSVVERERRIWVPDRLAGRATVSQSASQEGAALRLLEPRGADAAAARV